MTAALGCWVLRANRSVVECAGVERVFSLAALDEMLPCVTSSRSASAWYRKPRADRSRRLEAMKRDALINIPGAATSSTRMRSTRVPPLHQLPAHLVRYPTAKASTIRLTVSGIRSRIAQCVVIATALLGLDRRDGDPRPRDAAENIDRFVAANQYGIVAQTLEAQNQRGRGEALFWQCGRRC